MRIVNRRRVTTNFSAHYLIYKILIAKRKNVWNGRVDLDTRSYFIAAYTGPRLARIANFSDPLELCVYIRLNEREKPAASRHPTGGLRVMIRTIDVLYSNRLPRRDLEMSLESEKLRRNDSYNSIFVYKTLTMVNEQTFLSLSRNTCTLFNSYYTDGRT